jgi:hypothetical protein
MFQHPSNWVTFDNHHRLNTDTYLFANGMFSRVCLRSWIVGGQISRLGFVGVVIGFASAVWLLAVCCWMRKFVANAPRLTASSCEILELIYLFRNDRSINANCSKGLLELKFRDCE